MAKRPEKTNQTKADIREAFWRLYTQKPLSDITVGQICEAAGYNRATFYAHYQDRYDVLSSIEADVLSGALSCVESCLRSLGTGSFSKAASLARVVMYYESNKRYIYPLLGEQRDPAFMECLREGLKPLWRSYVIGPCPGRSDAEIDLILESALSGCLGMVSSWLVDPGDVSPSQIGQLIYDMTIRDVSEQAKRRA